MKVLVVADVLGEKNNGTTIACMNLIRYLKSQGDEVHVLCPDQDKKDLVDYFVVPNLHLGFILDYIIKKNNVSLSKPKTKIIKRALEGVDVCHIMLPFSLGKKTLKIARKMGIPCTAGFHCQAENFTAHIKMMNVPAVNRLVYKTFYKSFYRYVDAVHYPTEFIKDIFETTVKRKTNAYVISNGVNNQYRHHDVERKGVYSKHFNILFIGRYSKEKSHPLLIKAVAQSKYKDNIQIVFAGQGPYESSLRKLAKDNGLITPVMKFFSRKELVNVINCCDLYVHPAEIEIEAISCLEAITCGLVPVISDSKRSATNRFALTENNLFKNNDVKDLASKIDYWIEHPEERKNCSIKYLGYTEQFEQNKCMEKMRNMLLTYARPVSHTSLQKYYYRDEINDDFANNGVVARHNKPGYKYIRTNPLFKAASFLLYYSIKPLVTLMNKIVYHQKIIGKEKLKPYRYTGYFLYGNHTSPMGDAYTPNILTKKRNYMVVSEEATSIKGIGTLVNALGAIPVPSDLENIKPFINAIETRIKEKKSITIYPEAHLWPGYTKIRNFKSASFRYPYDLNAPTFVLTTTYQKRKHSKKPRMVTYVSGPFFPNYNLERKDSINDLRDRVYQEMKMISSSVPQVETIRYINISDEVINGASLEKSFKSTIARSTLRN